MIRFSHILSFLVLLIQFDHSALAQRRNQPLDTSAYLEQPNRIEFLFEDNDVEFTIINGEKDGLLVLKETTVRNPEGYGWVMYKLDSALNIQWTKLLVVPFSHDLKGWDYSEGNFYLLFSRVQFSPEEFSIYKVAQEDGQFIEVEISTVFPILLSHFEVIRGKVMMAGSVNYRPAVLTFDLDEPKPRVIPGIYNGNSELLEIYLNDVLGVFSIGLLERTFDKRFTISVKTYNTDNQLVQSNTVKPLGRNSIIDGAPTQFSSGYQYIAGAYSNRSPDYSRGLYLAKFVNGEQEFINYINYAELGNFFDYMGNRRRQRVKERIDKRNEKGKRNKFNYRLLVHDIIPMDDELLLIGEAYYPRYSTYSNLGPYTTSRFTGVNQIVSFKYTHAMVVAFDKNGKLKWDHSFPIDDVEKSYLEKTVEVIAQKDHLELHYLEENTIRTKVVKGGEVFEGNSYTPIRLGDEQDEMVIRDPAVEGIDLWYDDILYAYGEQEIEHKVTNRVRTRREIFYINKVRYNPQDSLK